MIYKYALYQMSEFQLPLPENFFEFTARVVAKYVHIKKLIEQNFGPDGIVLLALLIFLLLLIMVIYAHSIIYTIKEGKSQPLAEIIEHDNELFMDTEVVESANDNEPETPLYDEQEKAQMEKERELSADIVRISEESDDFLNLRQDYVALKQKMQKQMQEKSENLQQPALQTPQEQEITNIPTGRNQDFVLLILNLLARGVSEAKIIQALFYYYKSALKEEDVRQIVRSVRDFLGICNAGKFAILPDAEKLPPPADAIYELAHGNSAKCLFLLQSLLNYQMELADSVSGVLQDLNYAIAANYACLIGNLARLDDIDLAHNSFELATEISPQNVGAWNRLGDMYMLENATQKALIAFQNVLDIADKIMYAPQIADAQQYLAAYFMQMGLTEKAEQMRQDSDRFYDTSGIRTPLTNAENMAFQAILNTGTQNLSASIKALLSAENA